MPEGDVCGVRFRFQAADQPHVRASVAYAEFAESVVAALSDCLEKGLVPITPQSQASDDLEDAESEVRSLEVRVHGLQEQIENLLAAISSGSISPHLLQELDGRFSRLKADLSQASSLHGASLLKLERVKEGYEAEQSQRSLETMLSFVSGLRDPHSSIARRFFRSCVKEVNFHIEVESHRRRSLRWSGIISFTSDQGSVTIPFSGSEEQALGFGSNVDWIVERVISGQPLYIDNASRRFADGAKMHLQHKETLTALGLHPGESWILYVGDPLLIQAYLALYSTHSDVTPWQSLESSIRKDFGDPDRLRSALERTHSTLTTQRHASWARQRLRQETAALVKIAQGQPVPAESFLKHKRRGRKGSGEDWVRSNKEVAPAPCPGCGGIRRARLMIEEPIGYVCLNCRQDSEGMIWPTRFDRFIAYTEMWTAAGFHLEIPPPAGPSHRRRRWSSLKARLAALSTAEVDAIVADYQSGLPMRRIASKHGLATVHDVYGILEMRNLSRRRSPRPDEGLAAS